MHEPQPPPVSRKIRRVVIRGAALDGVPSREVLEEIGLVGGELRRVEEEVQAHCVSCNRMAAGAPLAAKCCVCGGLICSACVVFCSEEKCQKAVCSADRERVNGSEEPAKYRCRPHYDEHAQAVLIALIVVVVVVVVILRSVGQV